jgi:hypothetical protein
MIGSTRVARRAAMQQAGGAQAKRTAATAKAVPQRRCARIVGHPEVGPQLRGLLRSSRAAFTCTGAGRVPARSGQRPPYRKVKPPIRETLQITLVKRYDPIGTAPVDGARARSLLRNNARRISLLKFSSASQRTTIPAAGQAIDSGLLGNTQESAASCSGQVER